MYQARHDSRLFDKDVYIIAWDKLKSMINKQRANNRDQRAASNKQ